MNACDSEAAVHSSAHSFCVFYITSTDDSTHTLRHGTPGKPFTLVQPLRTPGTSIHQNIHQHSQEQNVTSPPCHQPRQWRRTGRLLPGLSACATSDL